MPTLRLRMKPRPPADLPDDWPIQVLGDCAPGEKECVVNSPDDSHSYIRAAGRASEQRFYTEPADGPFPADTPANAIQGVAIRTWTRANPDVPFGVAFYRTYVRWRGDEVECQEDYTFAYPAWFPRTDRLPGTGHPDGINPSGPWLFSNIGDLEVVLRQTSFADEFPDLIDHDPFVDADTELTYVDVIVFYGLDFAGFCPRCCCCCLCFCPWVQFGGASVLMDFGVGCSLGGLGGHTMTVDLPAFVKRVCFSGVGFPFGGTTSGSCAWGAQAESIGSSTAQCDWPENGKHTLPLGGGTGYEVGLLGIVLYANNVEAFQPCARITFTYQIDFDFDYIQDLVPGVHTCGHEGTWGFQLTFTMPLILRQCEPYHQSSSWPPIHEFFKKMVGDVDFEVPSNWNNGANTITLVGPGGSGGHISGAAGGGGGGGGGCTVTTLVASPADTITLSVGAGGSETDTVFDGTPAGAGKNAVTLTGGSGGTGATADGGDGWTATTDGFGGGGGGAGGPFGDGGDADHGRGGKADGGKVTWTEPEHDGLSDIDWPIFGVGIGGGAGGAGTLGPGFQGGQFGGGGGGASLGDVFDQGGGAGGDGLIIIEFEPDCGQPEPYGCPITLDYNAPSTSGEHGGLQCGTKYEFSAETITVNCKDSLCVVNCGDSSQFDKLSQEGDAKFLCH